MATNHKTRRVKDESSVGSGVQDVATAMKRTASEQVENLRDTANEYLDQGRMRLQEVGENVESHVREQPVKSLLIATGIGFLLGALWVRR
jgi:ElaB/YqjD/DUF883 family membrane-anchored ribosome-binding protein